MIDELSISRTVSRPHPRLDEMPNPSNASKPSISRGRHYYETVVLGVKHLLHTGNGALSSKLYAG
jgi:hypothetical protein